MARRQLSKVSVRTGCVDTPAMTAIMKTASNVIDPWDRRGMGKGMDIIAPPYSPLQLLRLAGHSDILQPCYAAMAVMIHSWGYELVPFPADADAKKQESGEAMKEKIFLHRIFDYPNPKTNFTSLAQQVRLDIEATGNGYMEVVPDRKGNIAALYWIPSAYTRLTTLDQDTYTYKTQVSLIDGTFEDIEWTERFRCIAEVLPTLDQKVYFKDINDDRIRSMKTGDVLSDETRQDNATAAIHFSIPCNFSPYGMPRYEGNLLEIMGNRQAEAVNYQFFSDNAIPRIAILVSGGKMGGDGVKNLQNFLDEKIKGHHHKIPIIEATPVSASQVPGEQLSTVKIEIVKLNDAIQKDAHFLEYRKSNKNAIRSAFRLPLILIGMSEDYNRATAREAIRVAENMVFRPERNNWDDTINRLILGKLGIKHWRFRTLPPKTTDYTEILRAISNVKDALTYKRVNEVVSDAIGKSAESGEIEFPKELEGLEDVPMRLIEIANSQPDLLTDGNEQEPTEKFMNDLTYLCAEFEKRINSKIGDGNASS